MVGLCRVATKAAMYSVERTPAQPAQMLLDPRLDFGDATALETIALGDDHVHELSPALHLGLELLLRFIAQRAHFGLCRFAESGQHTCIDGVCLCQQVQRASE